MRLLINVATTRQFTFIALLLMPDVALSVHQGRVHAADAGVDRARLDELLGKVMQ